MDGPVVKIGCCGWAMARRTYFRRFPIVEVQQTFYEPPRPDTLQRWRDEAPAEFEFTLKAWQLITHEASSPTYRRLRTPLKEQDRRQAGAFRLSDVVRRAWDVTREAAGRLRADKVLFQCPARFQPTPENRDRLREFFRTIDRQGLTCIWEPRGAWPAAEIAALCRELDLVHGVDPFQAEAATPGLRYYRLHGIGGYAHEFTDAELRALADRRARDAPTCFLFNNVSMARDAQRLQTLLR